MPWRQSGCDSRTLRKPSRGGGLEPAYPYGRGVNVVVPRPGEGVGSGNGTPVGGETTAAAAAVRRLLCLSLWSGYC